MNNIIMEVHFCDAIYVTVLCVQLVGRRLMDGGDEYLQLMDLATVIMHQFCHVQQ